MSIVSTNSSKAAGSQYYENGLVNIVTLVKEVSLVRFCCEK